MKSIAFFAKLLIHLTFKNDEVIIVNAILYKPSSHIYINLGQVACPRSTSSLVIYKKRAIIGAPFDWRFGGEPTVAQCYVMAGFATCFKKCFLTGRTKTFI